MKIIRLECTNINNLKGDTVIPFDKGVLQDAGIFAITGPTGSGKSTILDVITLALFNKIPRFGKAITNSEIEGQGSVMTHHTRNSRAAITYEIKGRRYTSIWSISKNRNDNLNAYDMEIQDENGNILDLKKSDVPDKNEEIIGLKYDQFIKSIILSQGEFAKFIKAKKDERGKLLENITGSYVYRKIGMRVFDKFRALENKLKEEKIKLDTIHLLSEEERQALESKRAEDNKNKEIQTAALNKLQQLFKVKDEMAKNALALEEKRKAKADNEVNFKAFLPQLSRLENYEKVSPYREKLALYDEALKNAQQYKENVASRALKLEEAKKSMSSAITKMSEVTKKEITVDNFQDEMRVFEKEITQLNEALKHIEKSGKEYRASIESRASQYPTTLGNPKEALPYLKSRTAELKIAISDNGVDENTGKSIFRKDIEKQKEDLNVLNELHHAYDHEVEAKSKIQKEEAVLKDIVAKSEQIGPLLESKTAHQETAKKALESLQKRKQDALLIASLASHRHELVDGKPCPLCGALEHPYSEELQENDTNSIDNEIQQARQHLDKLNNEVIQLTREAATSTEARKNSESKIKDSKEALQKAHAIIQSIKEKYEGKQDVSSEKIHDAIHHLEAKIKSSEAMIGALEELELNRELVSEYEKLMGIYAEYADTKKKRDALYQGDDALDVTNRIQNEFVSSSKAVETLATEIKKDKDYQEKTESQIKTIEQLLLPKLRELGIAGIEEVQQYMLTENDILQIKSRREELTTQKATIASDINTLEKLIKELVEKDEAKEKALEDVKAELSTAEIERDNLLSIIGKTEQAIKTDDEQRKRSADVLKAIDKLNIQLEKWKLLNKMIGDRGGSKFANFAQGLTLQNLLVFANRRLAKLSDRYLLDVPKKDDGALTVIDQYQGNVHRAVSTLSGGESFLISLALALSLSDMASRNVQLDSLFIDEGFGTLDQDTLEIATNTLERLQSESQKTVGVISHVETLKERINVQIKLEKDAQGYSKVVIE